MVDGDPAPVETKLVAGEYVCPCCCGRLRPWGFARRRRLRDRGGEVEVRPRRSRCASCLVTHVLLPTLALLRRRDVAEVIGEALMARFVGGCSRAKVAEAARVRPQTARRWCDRFVLRAEVIRAAFTGLAHDLDASLGPIVAQGSPAANALEAIGVAGAAAAGRWGPTRLWWFVAGASGGMLLANTRCDLPPPA
ncbi:MAG: DUF6431 domain-containing protein [Acetobacteraceae bacterium]